MPQITLAECRQVPGFRLTGNLHFIGLSTKGKVMIYETTSYMRVNEEEFVEPNKQATKSFPLAKGYRNLHLSCKKSRAIVEIPAMQPTIYSCYSVVSSKHILSLGCILGCVAFGECYSEAWLLIEGKTQLLSLQTGDKRIQLTHSCSFGIPSPLQCKAEIVLKRRGCKSSNRSLKKT